MNTSYTELFNSQNLFDYVQSLAKYIWVDISHVCIYKFCACTSILAYYVYEKTSHSINFEREK